MLCMIIYNKKNIQLLVCLFAAALLAALFFLTRVFLLDSFLSAEKNQMENDIRDTLSVVDWNAA